MQRERLGSRLGFILLSAGCAIGVGNVWKFPWMVGQYGGGAFVVFYVLFLLILGLPIMTMEFAVGRASQKSPVRAYQALEKPGQKWHIHGYLAMIGNYLLIYGKFGCPELGLTGAGISTLISRVTMCLVFAYLMYRGRRYERFREGYLRGKVNWTNYGRLVRLGLPVGLQMGVETASFNLSVIMMGWIGSAALAAHQVAGVITTLGFMVYYGIGAAVTIRVSGFKHLGAWREVRQASYAGLHLICTVALMVMLFIFLFRNQLGYIFTSDEEIVHLVALLSWSVILYQAGDGLQVLFANALRGMADVKWMAWVAFCCHFGLALPIGYFCGFVLDWGAQGVWAGFPVSLTTLGLLLWRRFHVRTRAYLKA